MASTEPMRGALDCRTGELVVLPLDPEQVAGRASLARADVVDALRSRRDELLRGSDWTQLPDAALSPAEQALWRAYRQALRDLPASTPDPFNPDWPEAPDGAS